MMTARLFAIGVKRGVNISRSPARPLASCRLAVEGMGEQRVSQRGGNSADRKAISSRVMVFKRTCSFNSASGSSVALECAKMPVPYKGRHWQSNYTIKLHRSRGGGGGGTSPSPEGWSAPAPRESELGLPL